MSGFWTFLFATMAALLYYGMQLIKWKIKKWFGWGLGVKNQDSPVRKSPKGMYFK